MMDDETVAAIQARVDVATPGPWIDVREDGSFWLAESACWYEDRPEWMSDAEWEEHRNNYRVALIDHEGQDVWPWARDTDMRFAYQARTDVPLLLADRAELTAQVARLKAGIAQLKMTHAPNCVKFYPRDAWVFWENVTFYPYECTCNADAHNAAVDVLFGPNP